MIRCLIVDDEPLALDVLRKFITTTPGLSLIGAYEKPLEAFSFLQQHPVELLFIDIQMPVLTGLELMRSLKNPPQVIFTTAYREYAAEGFEIQALDYLVKPIARDRFLKSIDRYNSLIHPAAIDPPHEINDRPFVFLKVDKAMIKLYLDEIYFIEALKNYVRIKTAGKDLVTYHTLAYMEEKLPPQWFQRIHKSFLVNIQRIDQYSADGLHIGGRILPVGKTYQDALDKILRRNFI